MPTLCFFMPFIRSSGGERPEWLQIMEDCEIMHVLYELMEIPERQHEPVHHMFCFFAGEHIRTEDRML